MKPVLHYVKDLNQVLIRDYIRNHRIHIIQEWTTEYTTLIGKLLKSFESLRIMDFYAGTATHDTNLFDPRITEFLHFLAGNLFNMADLAHIIFPLKDFNALECDCTCKRISHECRPVHQGKPVIITVKCLKDLVIGDSDCMTDITAGQCFSKNQDVREYQVCYEAVAGTSKSGRHLIKDQKDIILSHSSLARFRKEISYILIPPAP